MTKYNAISSRFFSGKLKKTLYLLCSAILILNSNFAVSSEKTSKEIYETIEKINLATDKIENKEYEEAEQILKKIKYEDFSYVKNQHLGDIAYLKNNYEDALAYYVIAQLKAKDKIMYDYVTKKIDYINTMKK